MKEQTDIFGQFNVLNREILDSMSPELRKAIAQRSVPGILVLTFQSELVYLNSEARKMLMSLNGDQGRSGKFQPEVLEPPEIITNLCDHLKQALLSRPQPGEPDHRHTPSASAISTAGSRPFTIGTYVLHNNRNGHFENAYFLVLLEYIAQTQRIDLPQFSRQYGLSVREIDVVKLLMRGCKNKEISERLCVSVYTTEGHIKRIMKKLGVNNRTSILGKLLKTL